MIKIVSVAMMLTGATVMVYTTYLCHSFIRVSKRERYKTQPWNRWVEYLALSLLYLFVVGFGVGLIDTTARDVEPIYSFVVVIFFLGSFFILLIVKALIYMSFRVRDKTMELMRTFVNAIDMKDAYTKGHSEHVYNIVGLFYDALPEEMQAKINKSKLQDASILHDCGKLSIKDEVLNKVGELSAEDWIRIKRHSLDGKKMLDDTCFNEISSWVLYHHERIDGEGYHGLKGNEIPVEARIIAIADTYSALSTDRIYREHMSHDEAIRVMREVAGKQLDAELLAEFEKIDAVSLIELLPTIRRETNRFLKAKL